MSDMIIETQIDQLAKLVSEKKKISVSDVARIMKTSESQVEEWVRILEESGYVELTYPALGEPIIIFKSLEPADVVKKKKELEDKKEEIEDNAKDFQKSVEKVEKDIEYRKEESFKLEGSLKAKLKDLDKNLKCLGNLDTKKQEIVKKSQEVKSSADSVCDEIDDIKGDIDKMESRINQHVKAMEGHEADVTELNKNKKDLEKEISDLERDIRLVRIIVKKPVSIPLISLKNIFSRHKKKTEKVDSKRKKLHRKALKMKSDVVKKKEHVAKVAEAAEAKL
ncbi:MAG: hypothetical protein V1678_04585 [Candidatus Aenigmatarchaeota archaeon]